MTTQPCPLSEIAIGKSGVIVSLGINGALRRRLLALGMLVGERVTVRRVAPLGDPLELEVKGYRLSLRKNEASEIMVAPEA